MPICGFIEMTVEPWIQSSSQEAIHPSEYQYIAIEYLPTPNLSLPSLSSIVGNEQSKMKWTCAQWLIDPHTPFFFRTSFNSIACFFPLSINQRKLPIRKRQWAIKVIWHHLFAPGRYLPSSFSIVKTLWHTKTKKKFQKFLEVQVSMRNSTKEIS